MYKNMIISLLTAAVAVLLQPELPANEKEGLYVGITTCLFIFLLFLEDLMEKIVRKRTKRQAERQMKEMIRHLRELNIWEKRNGRLQ